MRRKWILMIPAGIAAVVLFIFIGGTAVQLLWNWLMPPLFGWHELSFWQALGLLALCRILFGGLRSGGGHRGRWGGRMSDEERQRFRSRMRERCGFDQAGKPPETAAP